MDLSEYIETVTGQMRCKRARAAVARELTQHIEEQKQAYMEQGMEEALAEAEAVRQMGDAVEVGTQMDHIHRPRLDVRVLVLTGIFSIAACFFQGMVLEAQGINALSAVGANNMLSLGAGVLLMLGILFADYTFLGKRPLAVWSVIFILLPAVRFICEAVGIQLLGFMWEDRVFRFSLLTLMLPAYGGVIYYYRQKGLKGIFMCLLWLLGAAGIQLRVSNRTFLILINCLACMLLLAVAAAAGWIKLKRVSGLWGALLTVILPMAAALTGLAFYFFWFGASYQKARLAGFFGGEPNYITGKMRELIGGLKPLGELPLFGSRSSVSGVLAEAEFPWESANALLLLSDRLGILVMVLVLAGFAVLFGMMISGIVKQRSVLGGLMGTACLLGLMVPALCHILNNFTLIPYADAYIPFLYPGVITNLSCYGFLGLYLSVYRNTDIVPSF